MRRTLPWANPIVDREQRSQGRARRLTASRLSDLRVDHAAAHSQNFCESGRGEVPPDQPDRRPVPGQRGRDRRGRRSASKAPTLGDTRQKRGQSRPDSFRQQAAQEAPTLHALTAPLACSMQVSA